MEDRIEKTFNLGVLYNDDNKSNDVKLEKYMDNSLESLLIKKLTELKNYVDLNKQLYYSINQIRNIDNPKILH